MDIVLPHFASQNEVKRCPFKTFFRRRRRRKTFYTTSCFSFVVEVGGILFTQPRKNIIWRRKPPKEGPEAFSTSLKIFSGVNRCKSSFFLPISGLIFLILLRKIKKIRPLTSELLFYDIQDVRTSYATGIGQCFPALAGLFCKTLVFQAGQVDLYVKPGT